MISLTPIPPGKMPYTTTWDSPIPCGEIVPSHHVGLKNKHIKNNPIKKNPLITRV